MRRKIIHYSLFALKYELKRSVVFFILLLLFVLSTKGFGKDISKNINSINIIDKDNTSLSKELIWYLEEKKNFTISPNAMNSLIIPSGFEKDYLKSNATLDTGTLGVDSSDTYDFQLYKLNETRRISSANANLVSSSFLILLLFLTMIVNSFTNSFIISRKMGKLHFWNNHLNFWWVFLIEHIITLVVVIYFAVYSYNIRYIILLGILVLLNILFVYHFRRNIKLIDNMTYINYGVGILLVLAKLKNLRYIPIVDLIFEDTSFLVVIDILVLIVLLILVSKIKLTE